MTDTWRDDCFTYTCDYLGTLPDETPTEDFVGFFDERVAEAREAGWSAHGTKGCARIIANLWAAHILAPTRRRVPVRLGTSPSESEGDK